MKRRSCNKWNYRKKKGPIGCFIGLVCGDNCNHYERRYQKCGKWNVNLDKYWEVK
jgi:hypothetical protein